jgi:hypothetical protein
MNKSNVYNGLLYRSVIRAIPGWDVCDTNSLGTLKYYTRYTGIRAQVQVALNVHDAVDVCWIAFKLAYKTQLA